MENYHRIHAHIRLQALSQFLMLSYFSLHAVNSIFSNNISLKN